MVKKSELKIEFMRGQGPGGQHKNKTDSACKITHLQTGITAYCDCRSQHQSKAKALRLIEKRIKEHHEARKAETKKARRDKVIHDRNVIRTYDYKKGQVIDHRTKKTAPIKSVMQKGKLGLLK